jgi:hypothetical protein
MASQWVSDGYLSFQVRKQDYRGQKFLWDTAGKWQSCDLYIGLSDPKAYTFIMPLF